jgi:hypothetical protein
VSLNPELLRTEFLGLAVHFDEVALDREDLALFFAQDAGHYGLSRFEYMPDGGASLTGPEGAEFAIRPGGITSAGVVRLGLNEGRERVMGLLEDAVRRYSIGPMWIDDVTVVAIWDCESPEGGRRLVAEDILRLDPERLELIGDDETSAGLRLWRRMGDGSVDIAVEPMHADPSKVYIRLAFAQPDPVSDVIDLGLVIESLNDFLLGPLRSFILSLARSSG